MTRLTKTMVALVIAASFVSAPASAAIADRGWAKTWTGGTAAKARAKSYMIVLGVAF